MNNERYIVDMIGDTDSLHDLEMVSRNLRDDDVELHCTHVFHFNIDNSVMREYVQRFNERCDNMLLNRGYVEFVIETDICVLTCHREIEQNLLNVMIVILGNCRLQTCIDSLGKAHDVTNTEFAKEFNGVFSCMISDFDEACDFRITRVEGRT
jgi:hypothetical protein